MKTSRTIAELRLLLKLWKEKNTSLGLVPTMGFLHDGHESLIRRAVQDNDRVVVSIFVNPTQFGPDEDLDRYPRDLENDLARCEALGVDAVFCPEAAEMYPQGFQSAVNVSHLSQGLCGRSRPTHFEGVCTVVAKLFNITGPDRAYFGQKDAQQLAVIRRMTRDLNFPLEIVGCPIVREEDGLAKSSRNKYLSPEERAAAPALQEALQIARAAFRSGTRDSDALRRVMRDRLDREPLLRVDYLEVVDALTLKPVAGADDDTLIALAVFAGKTRLIDNLLLSDKGGE